MQKLTTHLRHIFQTDLRVNTRFDVSKQNINIAGSDQRKKQNISYNW